MKPRLKLAFLALVWTLPLFAWEPNADIWHSSVENLKRGDAATAERLLQQWLADAEGQSFRSPDVH